MNRMTVGVLLVLLLVVAPVSYLLYIRAGKMQVPSAASPTEVESTGSVSGVSASSPSSEMRQVQNTVEKVKHYDAPPPMQIDINKSYTAVLKTSKGVMRVALDAKSTPVTVNNFVFLSRDGFYDGTVFHRIIKGFMIQGGDPQGNGRGGPGYTFADEPVTKQYTRGTIAMANSGPNTNGSQFFIMHQDYPLPKNYVIFGQIDPSDTQSLATLDAIAATPVTDNGNGEVSKPLQNVTLESVLIQEL